MIGLLLIPFYLLANYYLLKKILNRLTEISSIFKNRILKAFIIILFTIVGLSPIASFLLSASNMSRAIKIFGFYWIAIIIYYFLVISVIFLLKKIFCQFSYFKNKKLSQKQANLLSILIICSLVLFLLIGHYEAINTVITKYDVNINKSGTNISNLKIALVSDLHLGYNAGSYEVKQMVSKINNENPDVVIIAGDIFNNQVGDIDDTTKVINYLKKLHPKYGVYAVYGNHDVDEKILFGFTFNKQKVKSSIKMDDLIKEANIKLLKDNGLLINDSFYLYGRLDYEKLNANVSKRKAIQELIKDANQNKPIIVIDHEPRELNSLSLAGVDLDLSGHTHDGQIFPANLLLKLFWSNSYGLKKYNKMTSIVTSGVGLFGPSIRIGTKSEIAIINLKFSQK